MIDNLAAAWNHEVRNYVNQSGSSLMFGVQMNLGGRSVFWEGLIPRIHAWELAYWPASVGTYLFAGGGYDRAERLLRKRRTLGVYQDRLVRKLRRRFRHLNVIVRPSAKLEASVRPNDGSLGLRDEVIDVRNQILEFLEADYDPADGMDYASFGTVHHAGGSLRMSSDHSGVVDENLKFESYRNLYCCDVSVFPHIPTANPSLTLVALAERLAGHLGV